MHTDLDHWFVLEVLPLEAALQRYLRRHCRESEDVADLRQEVYVRLYEAARRQRPDLVKPFVFATARNLLIDRARRAQIVSIEAIADLDLLDMSADELTPERHVGGNQELQLLQAALEDLPTRCREVVQLRKIDGLSQREVARHMGITEGTVEKQIAKGMRSLADAMLKRGVATGMATLGIIVRKRDGAA
ncbi:sigma-70 family RNA polymerase sigma factor [Rugamonas sp.]|uniref:RNA polymerase sigma factor n=1 Tax=Rugamonas sp. TaxID=1926287 RepID=UPI0025D23DFF|nr:sigma-70 family RNA polymerase sigma factor [Rugamonas sp.]